MSLDDLPTASDVPTVTAAQMAEADRVTASELGVPLEALMENASRQIAAATRALLGSVDGKRMIALAGTGHNGGDALGALRHLCAWGAQVTGLVAAARDQLRPLSGLQYDILARLDVTLHDTSAMSNAAVARLLRQADVVIDGLLGYSTHGMPRGEIARLVALANAAAAPIVAVDLPSGLDPDTGTAPGVAIQASLTVTLALPKSGLARDAAHAHVGELVLADIGIPAKAYVLLGLDVRGLFAQGDLLRVVRR